MKAYSKEMLRDVLVDCPSSMRTISHISVCRAAGAMLFDARPISESKSRD